MNLGVLTVLAVLLAATTALADTTTSKAKIAEKSTTFTSGEKDIRLLEFVPAGAGKLPAVLVLHGAGGGGNGLFLKALSRSLAAEGYATFAVYYMDRTGHRSAGPADYAANFPLWAGTVNDTLTHIKQHPQVDDKRVGLLGVSLGSYLSLSLAAKAPEQVAAVVEYFGGLPETLGGQIKKMPPVLILHGAKDTIVPVAEAHKLEKLLKAKAQTYQIKLYPDAGHGFTGADRSDAQQRTLAFFATYLKPAQK